MIGQMIAPAAADDVSPVGQMFTKLRFQMIADIVTDSAGSKVVIDPRWKILFRADYYQHGKFSDGLAPVHPVNRWICQGAGVQPQTESVLMAGAFRRTVYGATLTSPARR
jgi:hypothetical protein